MSINNEKPKKNVLLISPISPPMGGDAAWTENFLTLMRRQDEFALVNINTSIIGSRQSNLSAYSILEELTRSILIWKQILILKYKFKPSFAHMTTNCSRLGVYRDLITSVLLKLLRVPVILHCHANPAVSLSSLFFSKWIFALSLSLANKLILLNDQSMLFFSSCSKSKLRLIPNFIFHEFISPRKFISDSIKDLVFVGHFIESKGASEIVAAAKLLPHLNFYVAGYISPDYSRVNEPNIHFVGELSQNDISLLLDKCDVFIFPTHNEGFSMALLHAMSRGMPIVTTTVGANFEMLGNYGGEYFSVGNVDEMCQSIEKISSKTRRASMSKNNIDKVSSCYTDRILFDIYMREYKNI